MHSATVSGQSKCLNAVTAFYKTRIEMPNSMPTPTIRQTQLFIDGQWISAQSGKTFDTVNPANEEVITQVAEGDATDIEHAVQAARRAFDEGPWPE